MTRTTRAVSAERALQGEKKTQTFYMSWLRLYAVMAFWVSASLSLPVALSFFGDQQTGALVLPVIFCALLFELAFAIVIAGCNPVNLNAEGIRGFNFWGARTVMAWDEIASATPSRALGAPWLIVRSNRTQNTLWLPLFWADNQGFRKALYRLAPSDCPLLSLPRKNT